MTRFTRLASLLAAATLACCAPAPAFAAAPAADSAGTPAAAMVVASTAQPASPTPTAASAASAPKLGGYLQVRETYQKSVGLTSSVYHARLSVDGPLPERFSYRFLVELEAPVKELGTLGVTLRDACVRWTASPVTLTAGQFKAPFSRQYLAPISSIETADRAAVADSLTLKWDLGLMAEYAFGTAATASLGVFNGEGMNATSNRDSAVMVVGRLAIRPAPPVSAGASVAAYSSDSLKYGFELGLDHRGASLRAEAIGEHRRGGAATDYGWFVLGTYRVTPWLQAVAQQEDFRRPSVGPARRDLATTVGTNVELGGGKVRLTANYVTRRFGWPGVRRSSLVTQFQVKF